MAAEKDSVGERFPPPFIYLGALLLGLAAEWFIPLRSFGLDWWLLVATGAPLFVAGAAVMLAAAGLFRRLGTNVRLSQPTTAIATAGPYRWTRNPMYVGLTLTYLGICAITTAIWPLLFLPMIVAVIDRKFIPMEERQMEDAFGAQYVAYKSRVKRWL